MKKRFLKLLSITIVLFTFSVLTSNAQTTFGSQEVITTSANGANSVYACDIDGDGDFDVLSASLMDNKISWYENTDGNGTFGAQQIISSSANGARTVYACDIDGDGDIDVLSASSSAHDNGIIAWYENLDGNGTFGPSILINDQLFYAWAVFASDLDGDGDNDVLSTSFNDAKTAWYENTDGNGTFGPIQIISSATKPTSVYTCDIDGDGDNDVISTSFDNGKIAWQENSGNGTFIEEHIITTLAVNIRSVYSCDIDGDGDNDVLSACRDEDGKVAWYENMDGEGTFGEEQIIRTDPTGGKLTVYACDLDNDGDNDVLSADYYFDKIAWYENTDGEGTFGVEQIITTSVEYAYSVYACDIDNDGDIDVLSASYADNKVAWYRNLFITGAEILEQNNISIYPNPTSGIFSLEFADNNIQKIVISDISGKLLIEKTEILQNQTIDLTGFESGIYVLSIQTDEELIKTKIIKE